MLKTKGVQTVMTVFFMLLMCSANWTFKKINFLQNYDHWNLKEFAFDYYDCYMPCHFHCETD